MSSSIVWFRQDLRLHDNAAWAAAVARGEPIVPVFVWAPEEEAPWAPGGASRWWLHHALLDLQSTLRDHGFELVVRDARNSTAQQALMELVREVGASAVICNRLYEPQNARRDQVVEAALAEHGVPLIQEESTLLLPPEEVANKAGLPFRVYTPMWRAYQQRSMPKPVAVTVARDFPRWEKPPKSEPLEALELLPQLDWASGFKGSWGAATRKHALTHLKQFVSSGAASAYSEQRDLPAEPGTTRLSPYLHFGQVGVREVWAMLDSAPDLEPLQRQLVWREFAFHLLHHFPATPAEPLRPEFAVFPWTSETEALRRWQLGETGYPIVDAGMRQLWETGWMHNRVRMIVGSFLVKHLLQHWTEGARWFWDTLVDADLANNTLGWQWIAGCGADAAPYFRIFNPITQGERFDPEGTYVRRFVPELKEIPKGFIHRPWELGPLELMGMGVQLGKDYPEPVVAHSDGRARALAAFAQFKAQR